MSFFVSESIADKINIENVQPEPSIIFIIDNAAFEIESISFKKDKADFVLRNFDILDKVNAKIYMNIESIDKLMSFKENCIVSIAGNKKNIKDAKIKSIKKIKNNMYIIRIKATEIGDKND